LKIPKGYTLLTHDQNLSVTFDGVKS